MFVMISECAFDKLIYKIDLYVNEHVACRSSTEKLTEFS